MLPSMFILALLPASTVNAAAAKPFLAGPYPAAPFPAGPFPADVNKKPASSGSSIPVNLATPTPVPTGGAAQPGGKKDEKPNNPKPANPTPTPSVPIKPAPGVPANSSSGVPAIEGFTLTWSDEFKGAGGSLPDSKNWIIDVGTSYPGGPANWGTGEIQTYTNKPENVQITNGQLKITAIGKDKTWTSARVETQRTDFMAQEGKKMIIQASIAMPDVTGPEAIGYWPAFWTLGGNYRGVYTNWPGVGEFDIMENVNGLNKVTGVLHCDVAPGGRCNEMDGLGKNLQCPGKPCQGNLHTYTLTVDRSVTPETMTWSVDGQKYHSITEQELGAQLWTQTVQHGHFILLNLAMGGAFPNKVHGADTPLPGTVSGKSLNIDYVAVYNSI
ncbi:hypothetical protein HYALB_00006121 [Hymenoscyphus albidus]|uniref:GH16 domain-containing protein n=1 Tax=Hymenoscyphus albidus TaxID=595503 RepID=A0A9N9Q5X9_9HELO|nr:hypothetical protein HYALB_00006121 [Hymenoscyphus albidus]